MSNDDNILDDVFLATNDESEERKKNKAVLKRIQRKINRAGNFLFAIGIITIIANVLYGNPMSNVNETLFYIAKGAFYIGMGFLAIYRPIIALCLALVVYLGLFLFTLNFNGAYFGSSLIIRLFVSLILVTGISNAIQAKQFKKEHNL